MNVYKIIAVCIVLILVFVVPFEAIGQCSQCKMLAEQSASDDEILGVKSTTINSAILYIMAIPYIILTILFRKQIKRLFSKIVNSATSK